MPAIRTDAAAAHPPRREIIAGAHDGFLRRVVFGGRLAEWKSAASELAVPIVLVLSGEHRDLIPISVVLGAAGLVRLFALVRNGWWRLSPSARVWSSLIGVAGWAALAAALAFDGSLLGATLAVAFAVTDCANSWRAAADAVVAERYHRPPSAD